MAQENRKLIKRSVRFSLENANLSKKKFLDFLHDEYIKAVRWFIKEGKKIGKLSYEQVKYYPFKTFLSKRWLSCALKQAKWMLDAKIKNEVSENLPIRIDTRIYKLIKEKATSFDFWFCLRDSMNNRWLFYPIKDYVYRKKYDDWKMCDEVELFKRKGKWYLSIVYKKEVELQNKQPIGIDIGYNKLIVTSQGRFFGVHIKSLIERIANKQQGSKQWKKMKYYIKTEINKIINEVVTGNETIIIENLKNLKKGKFFNKKMRKKFNFWIYSYVLNRIKKVCETKNVSWFMVNPKNTSRLCPLCGYVDKANRLGEFFKCKKCNYTDDADIVGARNILKNFLNHLDDSKGVYSPLTCENSGRKE